MQQTLYPPAPLAAVARSDSAHREFTAVEWAVCIVACIGFAFDGYELILMSITVRPALLSLGVPAGSATFNRWVGLLLYVPIATAGLSGLLGGYLTDRLGRRRLVVWSMLLYSVSTAAAAAATSLPVLLVWRCLTLTGVGLEFVAALAWLAELFPDARRQKLVIGYSQVWSGAGNFLVTGAYYAAVTYAHALPALGGDHEAWRYTLAMGAIPAIPLGLFRSRLPESPLWEQKKRLGSLKRPAFGELFGARLRRATVAATLLAACVYATAYGVVQQMPRIVIGMPGVVSLNPLAREQIVSVVHFYTSLGDAFGRLLFAMLVVGVVRQRRLLRLFLLPAILVFPCVYLYAATHSLALLKAGTFAATMLMTAQFSFLGNYLPRLYPTHLRATGESFALNIGGRVIGTTAALFTPQFASVFSAANPSMQLAHAAGIVALFVLSAGGVVSGWLPEPDTDALPD
jgi:MFS family permease